MHSFSRQQFQYDKVFNCPILFVLIYTDGCVMDLLLKSWHPTIMVGACSS